MALIAIVNCGSSSIKFRALDPASGTAHADGPIEGIGERAGRLRIGFPATDGSRDIDVTGPIPDHRAGIDRLFQLMREGGLRRPGVGGKAYYMAKRAGVNLRIFTDKTVSPPAW